MADGVKFPTEEEITEKMVTALTGEGKPIDDLPNQWLSKALILGVRDAVYDSVVAAKSAYEASSPFTATGDELDRVCEERTPNIRRRQEQATKYRVLLQKSLPARNPVQIDDGSLITTQAAGDFPSLDIFVRGDYTLNVGEQEIEVFAVCSEAGEHGNYVVNLPVFPGMTGIDTVVIEEIVEEGIDREDDETLRSRLIRALQYPIKGGTEPDYESWALEVMGVESAKCLPLVRGNGTVDLLITGANGLPTENLIQKVQEHINNKVPAGGCDALVRSPQAIYVDVNVVVTLASGFLFENVKPHIELAISKALAEENQNPLIRIMKLRSAIDQVEGVFNFKLITPIEDITLNNGELAVLNECTITEAA